MHKRGLPGQRHRRRPAISSILLLPPDRHRSRRQGSSATLLHAGGSHDDARARGHRWSRPRLAGAARFLPAQGAPVANAAPLEVTVDAAPPSDWTRSSGTGGHHTAAATTAPRPSPSTCGPPLPLSRAEAEAADLLLGRSRHLIHRCRDDDLHRRRDDLRLCRDVLPRSTRKHSRRRPI